MEEQDIKLLLNQVKQLIKFDKKLSEQNKNAFNIFEALNVESKEELLHSRLICSLLDPKQNKQLSQDFLNVFIETLGIEPNFINKNSIKCTTEFYISAIDEKYENGGKIDILLEDTKVNHAIIIENKIHAGDQWKQLKRYSNFGKKYDEFELIYLTLFEQKATDDSLDGLTLDGDYKNITYQKNIKEWIEKCKKLAIDHPNMRQVLDQYLKTINKLTNQQMSNFLGKEISELLENENNWNAANSLVRGLEKYRSNLYNDAMYAMDNIDKNLIKQTLKNSKNSVLKEAGVHYHYKAYDGYDHFKIEIECCKNTDIAFSIILEWNLPKKEFVKNLHFVNWTWKYDNNTNWENYRKVKQEEIELRDNNSELKYNSKEELTEILQNEAIKTIKVFEKFLKS